MNLSKGIREAINLFGADIIKSDRLINVLMDYHAFEFKASRTILSVMIHNGYTSKFYDKYIKMDEVDDLYLSSVIMQLTQHGFQSAHAHYMVYSMAKALGWTDESLTYNTEAEEQPIINKHEYTAGGVKFAVCEVMGGKFAMGATPEQGISANFDERPAVEVEVDSFCIGETPVTQQLWCAVMHTNPSHFVGSKHPVERVTWHECIEFINRLNALTGECFRLPTEAEWEYAARGGSHSGKTKYAGTDDDYIDQYIWYKDNSEATTHEVKSKQPNELGIYDMSGNVSEWCHDWYFGSYANSTSNVNPTGPSTGQTKVIRGGSWNDKAINCRVSKRNSLTPAYRNKQIGFRIAMGEGPTTSTK